MLLPGSPWRRGWHFLLFRAASSIATEHHIMNFRHISSYFSWKKFRSALLTLADGLMHTNIQGGSGWMFHEFPADEQDMFDVSNDLNCQGCFRPWSFEIRRSLGQAPVFSRENFTRRCVSPRGSWPRYESRKAFEPCHKALSVLHNAFMQFGRWWLRTILSHSHYIAIIQPKAFYCARSGFWWWADAKSTMQAASWWEQVSSLCLGAEIQSKHLLRKRAKGSEENLFLLSLQGKSKW